MISKRRAMLVSLAFLYFFGTLIYSDVTSAQVMPDPNGGQVSEARARAMVIFQRLAGVKTPVDDPRLDDMETKVAIGDLAGAAAIATSDVNFYNVVVRDFAAKMSTKEETLNETFNDFQATVIGAVRDDLNAKTLLTGNYYYRGQDGLANVRGNLVPDLLKSNNHYEDLASRNLNYSEVLERVDGQSVSNATNQAVPHPEPAGILTSRAFLGAHAIMGTNRRLIQYSMRQFTCLPIQKWADPTTPDNMVGRDVDRVPGGDPLEYQKKCSGCHGIMDSFRPAVAKFDFDRGFVKHGSILAIGDGDNQIDADNNGIVTKMNRNDDVFPSGFEVTNTDWINNAVNGSNATYFGWRGPSSGSGFSSFGALIAGSKAFPRCMAQRVYRTICKREVTPGESKLLDKWGAEFEAGGYKLKKLFETIGTNAACIGKQ